MVEVHDAALISLVEQVEEQFRDRKAISEQLGELWEQCREAGYVPALVRQMAKERAMADDERNAFYETVDGYRAALGLLADTPLGAAAMSRREAEVVALPQPMPQGRRRRRQPAVFDRDNPDGTAA